MIWQRSDRFDPRALPLADAHYSREKIGSPQFVQAGRCVVFLSRCRRALWVTSWPQYSRHEWAGAWNNTLFRSEGAGLASALIRDAIAATRAIWPAVPALGIITMVDPDETPGIMVRGERVHGFCYLKAGFRHVGFTKIHKLWVWQMLPADMPEARRPHSDQMFLALDNGENP